MNVTEYCKLVENRLGWAPPDLPEWKKYISEAGKVRREIATDPDLYTWDNLRLAVELLARERKSRTPVGVFAHVPRALDLALDDEIDVEVLIREAVTHETRLGDPAGWVTRFARATGAYRAEVLAEWQQAVQ